MASALISGIPVLLDHSCMVGTSLENTTSGGDEAMKNYQKVERGRNGDCRVGKGIRKCETFIGRVAYRRKRKRGD
jgi:hypothetical protein